MAHGFLTKLSAVANPRASCARRAVGFHSALFEVTGELPETTSAELVGDQHLRGLQCMLKGVGSECWSSGMRFGECHPKITMCVFFDTCCHSHSVALISLFLF